MSISRTDGCAWNQGNQEREGREFPFTPELRQILEAQKERIFEIAKATNTFPFVAVRLPSGCPRAVAGSRIKDFRGEWKRACKAVALFGRIPHDFRRTAVRNLERAGVPRSAAMKITGHKTEAVYRRYAITRTRQCCGKPRRNSLPAMRPKRLCSRNAKVKQRSARSKTADS